MKPCVKYFNLAPGKGRLNTRAFPDEVPLGHYRYLQGIYKDEEGTVRRMRGYRRLLDTPVYNNADYHDQLDGYLRQPFNFLFSANSTTGFSKLFGATQNRISALNNTTKNWEVISDMLGGDASTSCADRAWWADQVGNIVVFTNNVDPVVYHVLDQPAEGDAQQRVATIPDLETLKVTKAGFVIAWNNIMILGNLVQDGERRTYRAIWSDYKRPLSYVEKSGVSLAGLKDLEFGEIILNGKPMANALWVYTNKGVWEVTVDGTQGLVWNKRYSSGDRPNVNCLVYPRTLVSTGSEHYYWSGDGIYVYGPYLPEPLRLEELHDASDRIFKDINAGRCGVHHGAYYNNKKIIAWSWARSGDDCPTDTLLYNVKYPFASYMGEGFTAFCNHGPDTNLSLAQFLLEQCACTSAELDAYGQALVKEGGYCTAQTDPTCATRPASFWTQNGLTDSDLDVTTEDWTQETADPDSLCVRLGGATVESLCGAEFTSDTCNPLELFVMASSIDNCLKEWADVNYREICTNTSGCGTYTRLGYKTVIRSGACHLNEPELEKIISVLSLEYQVGEEVVPVVIDARVGSAATAVDPNSDSGRRVIMWENLERKTLDGQAELTQEEYAEEGTRPNEPFAWPLYHKGKFLYFELTISNPNVSPPDTGGDVSFSRLSVAIGSNERRS